MSHAQAASGATDHALATGTGPIAGNPTKVGVERVDSEDVAGSACTKVIANKPKLTNKPAKEMRQRVEGCIPLATLNTSAINAPTMAPCHRK